MKEAISQEMMTDSSHSCIPEENETTQSASSLKSAAMLGIALSVGASGVIASQSEASAAIAAPTTSAAEALSSTQEGSESLNAGEASTQEIAAYHTVEVGESLWQISQRHRVGLRELKEANALPPETSIRVGQVLKVPAGSQSVETLDTPASNLIARLSTQEITQEQAGTAPSTIEKESPSETSEVPGTEQPTELNIAGSTTEISIEIADASLEAPLDESSVAQSSAEPVLTALAPSSSSFSHYQVRSGDTLSKIASSLGTTSEALIRANALANPNVILAGDTLRIPASSTGYVPAQTAPTTAPSISGRGLERRETLQLAEAPVEQVGVDQLAYLQDTVIRSDQASILEGLRESAPQEPASVGGETVTGQDLLSSRPAGSAATDPYVANLLEEVREIRSRSVQVSEVEADIAIDETAIAEEAGIESDSASLLARRDSRSEAPSSISERLARLEQAPAEDINADLLAAAPLSPDAYIPAQRPSAGQVVSPDMPMLPDANEYLPEAPDYFDGYIWPARGTLTSGYGWRWGRMHRGVDVAGPVGTPIVAAGAGVVERAGWNSGGYGNLVEIRHPDGSMTRYAHNNRLNVSAGQTVRQGQQIAEMGSTGYSTGPHLHFEIHQSGSGAVNPMAYLPNR